MFKRVIFLYLYISSSILGISQIPGIQHQPKWAMPFFFEDANGAKDTIWLGFDPDASCGPAVFDSIYEKWFKLDSNKFQVLLYDGQPAPQGFIRKIEITSCLNSTQFNINFLNGKMPVIMKWVDSLWYSDSLPFIQLTYYPRAKALMECSNGEPPYSNCLVGAKWTLTDSHYVNLFGPIKTDSFYFDGSGTIPPDQAIISLNLHIVDILYSPIGIYALSKPIIKIYPNPTISILNIEFPSEMNRKIVIYNILGNLVYEGYTSKKKEIIHIHNLSKGVYFLQISEYGNKTTEKIIIL